MSEDNGNTAIVEQPKRAAAPIFAGSKGLELKGIEDMYRFAQYVAASGFAPKGMDRPESIVVAIQMGQELGMSPMASLQNIAVINGRPSVWGDAVKAIVLASGQCVGFTETFEGDGDKLTAVCEIERRWYETVRRTFSVADAKAAELWSKAGPWKQYPKRMLQMRARSWACRDAFPDALRGLLTVEEAQEAMPIDVTPKREVATVNIADIKAGATPEGDHKATPESSPQPKAKTPKFDRKAALAAISAESMRLGFDAYDAIVARVIAEQGETVQEVDKMTDAGVQALQLALAEAA